MAVRYRSEFLSYSGVEWRVDIHDTAYTGDVTEYAISSQGSAGPAIEYDNGGDPHAVLMPSSAVVPFMVANEDDEQLILDIIGNNDETRFLVAIYKNDNFHWAGGVLADQNSWNDEYYPYIWQITASCGLGLLREKKYDVGATDSESKIRLRNAVRQILTLTPSASLFANNAPYIRWISSFREDDQGTTGTETSGDAWVRKRKFFDISATGTRINQPGAFWLEQILGVLFCRVYFSGGMWVIEEIPYRNENSVASVLLSKDGTTATAVTATDLDVLLSQSTNAARMSGGTWGMEPAVVSVSFKYDTDRYVNLIQGLTFNSSNIGPTNTNIEIDGTPLVSSLQLKGTLTCTVTNVDLSNAPQYAIIYHLTIRVGDNWYVRSATVSGGTISYSAPNWQASAGTYAIVHGFNLPIAVGNSATNTFYFDFNIPTVPDGIFRFGCKVHQVRRYTGGVIDAASYVTQFQLNAGSVYVLESGYLANTDTYDVYTANTTEYTNNSKPIELVGVFGDGPDKNSGGALYLPQTELTDTWTSHAEATGMTLQALLVSEMMRFYEQAIKLYHGDVISDTFTAINRLRIVTGEYYLLAQGSHALVRDEWTGCKFFQIYRAPSSIIIDTSTVDGEPVIGNSGGTAGNLTGATQTGGNLVEMQGSGAIAQLASLLKFNTVDGLDEDPPLNGTITSIPVATPMKANALVSGSTIMLLNPGSGAYDLLTVSAATADGDTAIAVTSTALTYTYDVGSFIIPATTDNFVQGGAGNGAATAATVYPTYNSNAAAVSGGLAVGALYIAGSEHEAAAQGTVMAVF